MGRDGRTFRLDEVGIVRRRIGLRRETRRYDHREQDKEFDCQLYLGEKRGEPSDGRSDERLGNIFKRRLGDWLRHARR